MDNRLTDIEKAVIECACNLAEAIVAGDYRLPKPMCQTINMLQDKVHELANERGWKSITDGCSQEFLAANDEYWKDLERRLRNTLKGE